MSQLHEPPDKAEITLLQQKAKKEKEERLLKRSDKWRNSLPERTKRAVSLAREKGAWNWLTVIPNKDTDNDLNKREFKDAIHLRYYWEITGKPTVFVCGARLREDHAMICKRGGFIIQRHNELRELEADLLDLVCNDVETEPALQEITGETLNSGANLASDTHRDIRTRGFFVCHPNADSYKDLTPEQVYRLHENKKKSIYERRVPPAARRRGSVLYATSIHHNRRYGTPRTFKMS